MSSALPGTAAGHRASRERAMRALSRVRSGSANVTENFPSPSAAWARGNWKDGRTDGFAKSRLQSSNVYVAPSFLRPPKTAHHCTNPSSGSHHFTAKHQGFVSSSTRSPDSHAGRRAQMGVNPRLSRGWHSSAARTQHGGAAPGRGHNQGCSDAGERGAPSFKWSRCQGAASSKT